MDEDGPETLEGTSKRRTAAQLMNDKQKEYDNRVPQDENPVEKVRKHNLTYPKLCDELEKRQSLSKIRMPKHGQLACDPDRFDPKCKACCRQRALALLQRYDVRPRCHSGDRKETVKETPRVHKTVRRVCRGVCKKCREKEHRRRLRLLVIASSEDMGSCFVAHGNDAQYILKHSAKRREKREKRPNNLKIGRRFSDRSSYHSFDSMNDEPMV